MVGGWSVAGRWAVVWYYAMEEAMSLLKVLFLTPRETMAM